MKHKLSATMATIQNLVLFVSSTSQSCIDPLKFVQHYQLPVNIVRLDSKVTRERAANGKYFQIHNVPSLVAFYADGDMQIFVSREKIISWLTNLMKSSTPPPTSTTIEEPPKSILKAPSKKKKIKKSKKKVKFQDSPEELEFVGGSEDDEGYTPVPSGGGKGKPQLSGLTVGQAAAPTGGMSNDVMKKAQEQKALMMAAFKGNYEG